MKPLDQVNRVVVLKPTACTEYGSLLLGEDAHPQRHQVSELPRIVPEIVEYQRHTVACLVCRTENQAEWPVDMPRGSFGERVQAMTGYLGGRFGISQRDMVEMFETVFHLEIGLGSIPAQEECVSQALKQPVDIALEYARQTGSQFVERIMTTITTLRQQKRDVLDYLVSACHANLLGMTAPSLLPDG